MNIQYANQLHVGVLLCNTTEIMPNFLLNFRHSRVDGHVHLFIQAQAAVFNNVEVIEYFVGFGDEVRVLEMCAIVSNQLAITSYNAVQQGVVQKRIFQTKLL